MSNLEVRFAGTEDFPRLRDFRRKNQTVNNLKNDAGRLLHRIGRATPVIRSPAGQDRNFRPDGKRGHEEPGGISRKSVCLCLDPRQISGQGRAAGSYARPSTPGSLFKMKGDRGTIARPVYAPYGIIFLPGLRRARP